MTKSVRFLTVGAITMALAVCSTGAASAQSEKKAAAPSVAGSWTLSIDGGPHGTTTMGLTLEQKDAKVSGTFATPHGDVPVEGEFADSTLTLSTPASGEDVGQITFSAKLKADGSLAGYMSSQMGDMTWTATRAKG